MLLQEAEKMNQILKESKEYKMYCEALTAVRENQELYQVMNSFRKRNQELQSYEDGINRYQEIHDLGLEYEKVLHHPLVNDFLVAEQLFSRMMTEVYEKIAEGLELDYGYME